MLIKIERGLESGNPRTSPLLRFSSVDMYVSTKINGAIINQSLRNKIFIEILVLFLSAFVLIAGGIMVTINAVGQLSPAMGIPMQFYYVGVPICGVLMIIYSGERLIRFVKELKETKEEK